MLILLPLLIAGSIFIMVCALAISMTGSENSVYLRRRIGGSNAEVVPVTSVRPEAQAPSMGDNLTNTVRGLLPEETLNRVQQKLLKAGNPTTLSRMMIAWFVGIIVLPIVYALIIFTRDTSPSKLEYGVLVGLFAVGFYGPKVWLDRKIRDRQKSIIRALPDASDLLLACIESGLGIDAAFDRVGEKVKGPLADELRRALGAMSLGRSRRDALTEIAERNDIEDLSTFISSIIQAEIVGASLGGVLRVNAEQMRIRRKQRAEKLAYQAPVKMVIPLVLFIFPAMFIVILGPACIQISGAPGL